MQEKKFLKAIFAVWIFSMILMAGSMVFSNSNENVSAESGTLPTLLTAPLYEIDDGDTDNDTAYVVENGNNVTWTGLNILANESIYVEPGAVLNLVDCNLYIGVGNSSHNITIQTNFTDADTYGIITFRNCTIAPHYYYNNSVAEKIFNVTNYGHMYFFNSTLHMPGQNATNDNLFKIGYDNEAADDYNALVYAFDSHINATDINMSAEANLTLVNSWINDYTKIELSNNGMYNTSAFVNATYSPIEVGTTMTTALYDSITYLDSEGNTTQNANTTLFEVNNTEGVSTNLFFWHLNDTDVIHPAFITNRIYVSENVTYTKYPATYPINVTMDLPSAWSYNKLMIDAINLDTAENYMNYTGHFNVPAVITYTPVNYTRTTIDDDGTTTTTTFLTRAQMGLKFDMDDDQFIQIQQSTITADAGPDQVVYEDTVTNFTGAASIADSRASIDAYKWVKMDENLSTMETKWGRDVNFTFADPGTYYVQLTAMDNRSLIPDIFDTDLAEVTVEKEAGASTTAADDDEDDEKWYQTYRNHLIIAAGVIVILTLIAIFFFATRQGPAQ